MDDVADHDLDDVGGKARGIGRLLAAGANVPAGFCIRSTALNDLLEDQSAATVASMRNACTSRPLPGDLESAVASALAALPTPKNGPPLVLVRSSALNEDVRESRAPGVYESVQVMATPPDVVRAIRTVWESSFSENSLTHQARTSPEKLQAGMAVIVQCYLQARQGGAIFTIDTATGDPCTALVSWTDGHPGELLAGTDIGYARSLQKDRLGDCHLPPTISEAVAEALRLERLLDEPLDLEFIIAPQNELYFVQCRPLRYEPLWRDAAPVLDPAHDHGLHSPKILAARLSEFGNGDPFRRIIIGPAAFNGLASNQSGTSSQVADALKPLLEAGDVALRPAYWSALHSPDNMPQSGRLKSVAECISHLENLRAYINDHRLNDYTAEIAVLAGNWLPVVASAVVAVDQAKDIVHIDSVAGYPEGLEKLPYQTAIVKPSSGEIIETGQVTGALTVEEATSAAAISTTLAQQFSSPLRIEFLVVTRDQARVLVVWQADRLREIRHAMTYQLLEPRDQAEDASAVAGNAIRIASAPQLAAMTADHAIDAVIVLDLSQLPPRDREGQVLIASHAARLDLPVVLRASPLSHLSAMLRDYGVAVYPVRFIPDYIYTGTEVVVVPDL